MTITHYCFFGEVCIVRVENGNCNSEYYIGCAPWHGQSTRERLLTVINKGCRYPDEVGDELLDKKYLIFYD